MKKSKLAVVFSLATLVQQILGCGAESPTGPTQEERQTTKVSSSSAAPTVSSSSSNLWQEVSSSSSAKLSSSSIAPSSSSEGIDYSKYNCDPFSLYFNCPMDFYEAHMDSLIAEGKKKRSSSSSSIDDDRSAGSGSGIPAGYQKVGDVKIHDCAGVNVKDCLTTQVIGDVAMYTRDGSCWVQSGDSAFIYPFPDGNAATVYNRNEVEVDYSLAKGIYFGDQEIVAEAYSLCR